VEDEHFSWTRLGPVRGEQGGWRREQRRLRPHALRGGIRWPPPSSFDTWDTSSCSTGRTCTGPPIRWPQAPPRGSAAGHRRAAWRGRRSSAHRGEGPGARHETRGSPRSTPPGTMRPCVAGCTSASYRRSSEPRPRTIPTCAWRAPCAGLPPCCTATVATKPRAGPVPRGLHRAGPVVRCRTSGLRADITRPAGADRCRAADTDTDTDTGAEW